MRGATDVRGRGWCRWRWLLAIPALIAAMAVFWPAPAHAHLVSTGLGPFYDGVTHVVVSPESLMALLGLALWAGIGGAATGRTALAWGIVGWVGGAVAGFVTQGAVDLKWIALVPPALGLAVAAGRKPGVTLAAAVGLLAAGVPGFVNGAAMAGEGPGFTGLAGTAVPVAVVLAITAAIAVSAQRQWSRTAIRVAGSWIAAISLLLVGWWWKTGA